MEVLCFVQNVRRNIEKVFFKCAHCKIDLVPELPPEPERYVEYEYINFVNIKTYSKRYEAELAKGLLSGYGIDGVVQGDEDGGYDTAFAKGVQLLVKEKDVWEAKKILSEIEKMT